MFEYFIKKLNKDNRGFTLIELVIVIAIIGILTAIAITKMGGTVDKAAISAHNANVRTLESAASMYIADEGLHADDVIWTDTGGKKSSEITTNDANSAWAKYLQEWPKMPKGIADEDYKVTIKNDGTIIVEPDKK